jgi:hypothetical protein
MSDVIPSLFRASTQTMNRGTDGCIARIPICQRGHKMSRAGTPVDINRIAAHGSNVVAGAESGRDSPQDTRATPPVSHEPPQNPPAAILRSDQPLSASSANATISTAGASPSPTGTSERELPAGTVTFLFTDIEGSTRLWETESAAMARSLVLHDQTLRVAFARHGGVLFSTTGDGMAVAFSSA